MEYNIGDIVRTKKPHPCGSKLWEITRVGVDFKLKCEGCGHVVMLPREKALKAITKKIEKGETYSLLFLLRTLYMRLFIAFSLFAFI